MASFRYIVKIGLLLDSGLAELDSGSRSAGLGKGLSRCSSGLRV